MGKDNKRKTQKKRRKGKMNFGKQRKKMENVVTFKEYRFGTNNIKVETLADNGKICFGCYAIESDIVEDKICCICKRGKCKDCDILDFECSNCKSAVCGSCWGSFKDKVLCNECI